MYLSYIDVIIWFRYTAMAFSRGKQMIQASFKITKSRNTPQRQQAEFWIKNDIDQDGFDVRHINKTIGRGVFTTKDFEAGDFLLEYVGRRLTEEEASEKEKLYQKKKITRSYMFYYKVDGKQYV